MSVLVIAPHADDETLGMGGNYAWADGRYALYAEALVTTSLDNFSDSYGYKGTTGFRMRW